MVCSLISLYFDSPQIIMQQKQIKTLHHSSRDILNFHFADKIMRIISLTHFLYDFSTKMLLMLYSINWPKFYCLVAFTSSDIG